MALTAAALIAPRGDIDPSMFPADDEAQLVQRVNTYLARATALVTAAGVTGAETIDAAVQAYVNHLAFAAVATRLSAQAMTIALSDQGSRSRTQGQLDYFTKAAAAFLEEYEELVPVTVTSQLPPAGVSTHMGNRYCW